MGISKAFPVHAEQCITFYPRGIEQTQLEGDPHYIRRPRSVVTGQFTSRINRFSLEPEFLMIMVVFQPGVLPVLLRVPATELNNRHIDLESFWGSSVRTLEDQLAHTSDYDQMIQSIETYLLQHLQRISTNEFSHTHFLHTLFYFDEMPGMDQLAKQAFLSGRQFERVCQQYLGVSPKYFVRAVRFQQAIQFKRLNPSADWLRVSIEMGYHDYQHMVRDFKDFAAVRPQALFHQEQGALERVLGLTQ